MWYSRKAAVVLGGKSRWIVGCCCLGVVVTIFVAVDGIVVTVVNDVVHSDPWPIAV